MTSERSPGLGVAQAVEVAQTEMVGVIQVMVVDKVVREAQLTDADLDQLLAQAKALADSAVTTL